MAFNSEKKEKEEAQNTDRHREWVGEGDAEKNDQRTKQKSNAVKHCCLYCGGERKVFVKRGNVDWTKKGIFELFFRSL